MKRRQFLKTTTFASAVLSIPLPVLALTKQKAPEPLKIGDKRFVYQTYEDWGDYHISFHANILDITVSGFEDGGLLIKTHLKNESAEYFYNKKEQKCLKPSYKQCLSDLINFKKDKHPELPLFLFEDKEMFGNIQPFRQPCRHYMLRNVGPIIPERVIKINKKHFGEMLYFVMPQQRALQCSFNHLGYRIDPFIRSLCMFKSTATRLEQLPIGWATIWEIPVDRIDFKGENYVY